MRRHLNLMALKGPGHAPAQSNFEAGQGSHDDGVNVLRMKPWVVQQKFIARIAISVMV
jgi:hypothetical protein